MKQYGHQPHDSDIKPPLPTTGSGVRSPMPSDDGRGKIKMGNGTPEEIANYKAAFALMNSPSGRDAMSPMMESTDGNASAINKLLEDFSTGELFNALLSRINFDGMDPRTFSLCELHGAIDGAEWPNANAPPLSEAVATKSEVIGSTGFCGCNPPRMKILCPECSDTSGTKTEPVNETVEYILRFGGRCHDCADSDNGHCDMNGLPCVPDEARDVIRHVLTALEYGRKHGFIAHPASLPSVEDVARMPHASIDSIVDKMLHANYEDFPRLALAIGRAIAAANEQGIQSALFTSPETKSGAET